MNFNFLPSLLSRNLTSALPSHTQTTSDGQRESLSTESMLIVSCSSLLMADLSMASLSVSLSLKDESPVRSLSLLQFERPKTRSKAAKNIDIRFILILFFNTAKMQSWFVWLRAGLFFLKKKCSS